MEKRGIFRGTMLGLAVGDAMGYTIDTKSWAEIQEDYGPYGLMGYDLRNGYAEVSSHTQVAAFSCKSFPSSSINLSSISLNFSRA